MEIKNLLLTEEQKTYFSKLTDEQIEETLLKKKINFKTGDMILSIGEDKESERIVKRITKSSITHVMGGIEYENEMYIHESNTFNEATKNIPDIIHGKNKNGVRMCLFNDVYRKYNTVMYIRRITPELSKEHVKGLLEFYRLNNSKKFETNLLQLLNSELKIVLLNKKNTKRYFCSEFMAERYQFIGLMKGPRNGGLASKFYTPKDFIKWQPDDKRFKYGPLIQIKP